jgi:hypothetical protein
MIGQLFHLEFIDIRRHYVEIKSTMGHSVEDEKQR